MFERDLALGHTDARSLANLANPRIFKTHLPACWRPPLGRAIYLTRDPQDVVLSFFHLYRTHLGYTQDLSAFFEEFVRGQVQYGSCFRHRAGWQRAADRSARVVRVRYEDMQQDLVQVARQLAQHLGLGAADVDAACRMATFAYMKAHEAHVDHATASGGAALAGFIRSGQVGEGQRALTPQMRMRLEAAAQRRPWLPQLEWRLFAFLH